MASWLTSRRKVRKGTRKGASYDSEMELGTSLGLPKNWLDDQRIFYKEKYEGKRPR